MALLKEHINDEWIHNWDLALRRTTDVLRDYFGENYKKGTKYNQSYILILEVGYN